jgi:alpha-D-xyloside xylohydrolase
MNYRRCFLLAFILAGTSISHAQQLSWTEVAEGVWKAEIGQPEQYALFNTAGIAPNLDAIREVGSVEFPLDNDLIVSRTFEGRTSLRFPLQKNEQIFGFGLNFKSVHQRGHILELHVDHYGGKDNGRTHAPVPFYVSDRGYGVFINSARYIKVWAGTGARKDSPEAEPPRDRNSDERWTSRPYSDAVEILVPAPGVEVYVFGGPTALDAVRRYNLYNGGGCLPPRWGLGFSQRVPRLFNSQETIAEAQEFARRGFPLDVVGLEPGWQSKSYPCTFSWDQERFANPSAFISRLAAMGVRVNLWTNPYVSPQSPLFESIAPFTGSHTVWGGLVPDLNKEESVRILAGYFQQEHLSKGVSGYKIDETDGYDQWLWPDVAVFPSGVSAEQTRQTYGMLWQKFTTELFREANTRTFGLTRATNAGGVALPYVIYNDYYSHEGFITALCNSGFNGLLWTPEVRSSKTPEEWLRRMQSVCFSPMALLNAWSSGTKPWSYPEVEKQVRDVALLRMRLLPYFYTAFARYHFEGIPPFRAMALEPGFSGDEKTEGRTASLGDEPYPEPAPLKEIKDQYMAGEFLLVAPMFAGETSRDVVLPPGKWFDFYTGEFAGEGEVIHITPGLDKIPVYVKDGGIIPMMDPMLHAPGKSEKYDLEIRHYGDKILPYRLYDDDGVSFDYEKGMFSWRAVTVSRAKGKWKGTISKSERGKPDNIGAVAWRFMGGR